MRRDRFPGYFIPTKSTYRAVTSHRRPRLRPLGSAFMAALESEGKPSRGSWLALCRPRSNLRQTIRNRCPECSNGERRWSANEFGIVWKEPPTHRVHWKNPALNRPNNSKETHMRLFARSTTAKREPICFETGVAALPIQLERKEVVFVTSCIISRVNNGRRRWLGRFREMSGMWLKELK
jgi:hypothetical protein